MSNSRPSQRQLQAFYKAMNEAQQSQASIPSLAELARRRDAHLASLR